MQRCTKTFREACRHGVWDGNGVKKKKKRETDATVKTMLPVSPSTAVGTRGSLGAAGGNMLSNLSDSASHKFLNLT